jgi:hypothetical protein
MMAVIQEVQRRLTSAHAGMAAILLTSRLRTTSGRFRYVGHLLSGRGLDELFNDIYVKVAAIDHRYDLLQNWR